MDKIPKEILYIILDYTGNNLISKKYNNMVFKKQQKYISKQNSLCLKFVTNVYTSSGKFQPHIAAIPIKMVNHGHLDRLRYGRDDSDSYIKELVDKGFDYPHLLDTIRFFKIYRMKVFRNIKFTSWGYGVMNCIIYVFYNSIIEPNIGMDIFPKYSLDEFKQRVNNFIDSNSVRREMYNYEQYINIISEHVYYYLYIDNEFQIDIFISPSADTQTTLMVNNIEF